MSLPNFSGQAERCSTAAAAASLFAEADRYRRFAKVVYPGLAASRATLERCSCAANGRVASEPVLLLGVRLLQFLDGLPDRQAVDMGHYHVGWNFALNRPLGDARCHPTRLVNFRQRLATQDQRALVFQTILGALKKSGLGVAAEPPAVGFDPNVCAGQPDAPAGLGAGELAAGPARRGAGLGRGGASGLVGPPVGSLGG